MHVGLRRKELAIESRLFLVSLAAMVNDSGNPLSTTRGIESWPFLQLSAIRIVESWLCFVGLDAVVVESANSHVPG